MTNFELAKTFADQFDPPLTPVPVKRINNVPHRDAWMVAAFDKSTGYGITAHAYGGKVHAFIEAVSTEPAVVGKLMASSFKKASNPQR